MSSFSYCDFSGGRLCPNCKRWLSERAPIDSPRRCGPHEIERPPECSHLGEPTGRSIPVQNCSCGAMTTVFECGKFKLCAPLVKIARATIDDKDVTLCRDCEHNPANHPANPTS